MELQTGTFILVQVKCVRPGNLLTLTPITKIPEGVVVGSKYLHRLLSNINIRIPIKKKFGDRPPYPRAIKYLGGQGG